MRKNLAIFLILAVSCMIVPVSRAQTLSHDTFNTSVHVCGNYRFDVTRVVDGFQIKVTDGTRVRAIFHRHIFGTGDVYSHYSRSEVISGCYGNALAIIDRSRGRYAATVTISLLDPASDPLRIKALVSRELNYGIIKDGKPLVVWTKPIELSAQMDELLSKTTDPWTVTRTELVSKQRIASAKSDTLNDRSFYVFDGKGRATRRMAASDWNTTMAEQVIVCGDAVYTLYAKKFAEHDTATSTYPAEQYIIERSEDGQRKLIPIPYTDGSWRDPIWGLVPNFGRCFGENVSIIVLSRVSIVSNETTLVGYLDPRTSIEASYLDDDGYYTAGDIRLTDKGIEGNAAIRTLNPDGTVTERKPVFFRDLKQYFKGTTMKFRKDPQYPNKITVMLEQPCDICDYKTETSYFMETDGIYKKVSRDESSWRSRHELFGTGMTPLYVSADKDMLTLRGPYLKKPMLLHGLTGKAYTLQWNRIGPLEQDGTRKVWYAFSVGGATQAWLAVVR